MNAQVRLWTRSLAGWVNRELVASMRNTKRGCCSIRYTTSKCLLKCLPFCLFPVLARIAESPNVPCQNRTMLLEITVFQLSIKFAVLRRRKKLEKPYRKLTVACHRHPTEKYSNYWYRINQLMLLHWKLFKCSVSVFSNNFVDRGLFAVESRLPQQQKNCSVREFRLIVFDNFEIMGLI